jgi:hypothetical protein
MIDAGAGAVFIAFRDSPEFGPLSPFSSEGVARWPQLTADGRLYLKPAFWALKALAASRMHQPGRPRGLAATSAPVGPRRHRPTTPSRLNDGGWLIAVQGAQLRRRHRPLSQPAPTPLKARRSAHTPRSELIRWRLRPATTTVAAHTFTVTAADAVGNPATKAVH